MAEASLKLLILPPVFPECWNYMCDSKLAFFFFFFFLIEGLILFKGRPELVDPGLLDCGDLSQALR